MLFEWINRGTVPIYPMKKPKSGQVRIACSGDSITYGYGVENWRKNNYPAVLGTLLGNGCCVNNFGVPGSTAHSGGDRPYVKERVFQKSLAFCPDVVILMLGTNDSKPYNWKGQAVYREELRKILQAYKALPSVSSILLLAPPPAWGDPVAFDIQADVLKDEIRPVVQTLAKDEKAQFLDLHSVFKGCPEKFWDGVHPNAAGAKMLAKTICQAIAKEGNVWL